MCLRIMHIYIACAFVEVDIHEPDETSHLRTRTPSPIQRLRNLDIHGDDTAQGGELQPTSSIDASPRTAAAAAAASQKRHRDDETDNKAVKASSSGDFAIDVKNEGEKPQGSNIYSNLALACGRVHACYFMFASNRRAS